MTAAQAVLAVLNAGWRSDTAAVTADVKRIIESLPSSSSSKSESDLWRDAMASAIRGRYTDVVHLLLPLVGAVDQALLGVAMQYGDGAVMRLLLPAAQADTVKPFMAGYCANPDAALAILRHADPRWVGGYEVLRLLLASHMADAAHIVAELRGSGLLDTVDPDIVCKTVKSHAAKWEELLRQRA